MQSAPSRRILPRMTCLATTPTPRTRSVDWMPLDDWQRRHARNVNWAETVDADLVVYGASVVEGWGEDPSFVRLGRQPLALGLGGDRTQHLLWRLAHGELGRLRPRCVVTVIGNNNLAEPGEPPDDIALGILAVHALLRERWPTARHVSVAIPPNRERPDEPVRCAADLVNARVRAVARDFEIVDLSGALTDDRGWVQAAYAADFIHPTPAGYARFTDTLLAALGP
jgi:beta-glucosidase